MPHTPEHIEEDPLQGNQPENPIDPTADELVSGFGALPGTGGQGMTGLPPIAGTFHPETESTKRLEESRKRLVEQRSRLIESIAGEKESTERAASGKIKDLEMHLHNANVEAANTWRAFLARGGKGSRAKKLLSRLHHLRGGIIPDLKRSLNLAKEGVEAKTKIQGKALEKLSQEEKFQTDITRARIEREELISSLLNKNLEDISSGADAARSISGQIASEKGLLRSSFATKRIQDVSLEEQQRKGEARLQAFQDVENQRAIQEDMFNKIFSSREDLELRELQDSLLNVQARQAMFDGAKAKEAYSQRLSEMIKDSKRRAAFAGFVGSMFQAAGIMVGASLGGPGGAVAGGAIGRSAGEGVGGELAG